MSTIHFNNFNIKDVPVDTVFVLDTNVLYYVHSGYSPKNPKDGITYSNIIQKIMNNGFKIHVSALSVQELLFCIENKEYKIYHEHTKILDKKLIGGLSCRLLRFSRFSRQPTFLYYGCRIECEGGAINDTERNETSGYLFSGR